MHLGRFKVMPNAIAAETLAHAIALAYAAQIGRPWPMPPDVYGPGRQPEPREAFYQQYFVRPVQHLVPAPAAAIALGGGAMNGNVEFEDLSQADKDILQPPGLQSAVALGDAAAGNLKPRS